MYSCTGNWYTVGVFPQQMIDILNSSGDVMALEPNYPVKAAALVVETQQNTPSWGLSRIARRDLHTSKPEFQYPETAGGGISVYVLDTGIDNQHPELSNRVILGPNFSDTGGGTNDLNSTDDNGHGTFIAGIIGGNSVGVAKQSTLVSVKVLDSAKGGYVDNVVQGLDWVYDQVIQRNSSSASVINLSIDAQQSDVLNQAITACVNAGITVVAAAGNGDQNLNPLDACTRSPASCPDAIIVGATDDNDNLASFSNYGTCVDLNAPGVDITSLNYNNVNSMLTDQGTSFSAPHVAGVVALILADSSGASTAPQSVKSYILSSATENALKGVNNGTPNLLLYSGMVVGENTNPNASGASGAMGKMKWLKEGGRWQALVLALLMMEVSMGWP